MSTCNNCFDNCDYNPTDQCVAYTGPNIAILGICTGQQLSFIENVILTQLQNVLSGIGINITTLTLNSCSYVANLVQGVSPTLANLLQVLFDSQCTLNAAIVNIQNTLGQSYSFNTACLQNLPTNPQPNDILQAALNVLCSMNTALTAIQSDYVKASQLNSLVTTIIQQYNAAQASSGSSSPSVTQYYQFLPPNVAFPYFGDLSNFDNNGVGLPSKGFQYIYILGGINGAPDWRGRTVVGAVNSVPGSTLDPAVDPNNPANPNSNYSIGDVFGENTHLLVPLEIPSHVHGVNDPGHTHTLCFANVIGAKSGGSTFTPSLGNNPNSNGGCISPQDQPVGAAVTGITLTPTGGSLAHNNVQPSVAAVWIGVILP
jgi:microcystin-dependent protein